MTAAADMEECFEPAKKTREELSEEALTACKRGDAVALRWFVLRYQGLVFAFLSRSLGAGPHVEDLAQEVFLRAYQALPRFDPQGPAKLSTWLLKIATNLTIDARKRKRLPTTSYEAAAQVSDPATPETEWRRKEIASAFERAASQLHDDQRDVFILAEFHGLSMTEIATVLGVPENTVKTRLFRARERLRSLLGSYGRPDDDS